MGLYLLYFYAYAIRSLMRGSFDVQADLEIKQLIITMININFHSCSDDVRLRGFKVSRGPWRH
jgi:hypothetical protein